MEPWPWSLKMAAFVGAAVLVLWLGTLGYGQGFLGEVASELGTIESDVRTGILPGLAGVLLALISVAVGVAVVGVFTRGR